MVRPNFSLLQYYPMIRFSIVLSEGCLYLMLNLVIAAIAAVAAMQLHLVVQYSFLFGTAQIFFQKNNNKNEIAKTREIKCNILLNTQIRQR